MTKYIPRALYLNAIRPYQGTDLIKVIVGQRRVGKSYMVYQLIDDIRKQNPKVKVIYINKEEHQFGPITDARHCSLSMWKARRAARAAKHCSSMRSRI